MSTFSVCANFTSLTYSLFSLFFSLFESYSVCVHVHSHAYSLCLGVWDSFI